MRFDEKNFGSLKNLAHDWMAALGSRRRAHGSTYRLWYCCISRQQSS